MKRGTRRRRGRWLTGAALGAAVVVAPEFRAVPEPEGGYPSLRAMATDAVATGATGWDLVAEVQRRVHDQFLLRSYRQPWRRPDDAFRIRAGYAVQYNLALCEALRDLGFDARPVFAARVRTESAPWWRMGHVWVRVRYNGRTKSCCARHATAPGEVDFVPVSEVMDFKPRTQLNVTLAFMLISGVELWRSAVLRRPLPAWMETAF